MYGSAYNSEDENQDSSSSEEESDWSLDFTISDSEEQYDQADEVNVPTTRLSSP